MHPVFDAIAEITAFDRWLVRGWRYLGSRRCRLECHDEWRRRGPLFAFADITFLLLTMAFEVLLLGAFLLVRLGH